MRYTPAGIAVTTASLAVKSYPTAERPDWIRLRFWRGAAETMNEYGRKGSKLHVEGKLRVSSYVDKEGVTRTSEEVVSTAADAPPPSADAPRRSSAAWAPGCH